MTSMARTTSSSVCPPRCCWMLIPRSLRCRRNSTDIPWACARMQLPDTAVKSYFLTAFGRPVRQQTRESERTSVPTITQALHIINGDTLNNKLRAPGSSVDMLLKLGFSDEQIVDYLYLASFSRYPKDRSGRPCRRPRIGGATEDSGGG